MLGTGGRGLEQPGRLQLRPLLSLMVGNMSGSALLPDNCSVYDAISGIDTRDRSRNVCHGQRVAAIEEGFETPHSGKIFNILSLPSLLSHTLLLPSPTFLPTHKFPLSKITVLPLSFLHSLQLCQIELRNFLLLCFLLNFLQTMAISLAPISSRFWKTSPQPQNPILMLLCTIPRKRL